MRHAGAYGVADHVAERRPHRGAVDGTDNGPDIESVIVAHGITFDLALDLALDFSFGQPVGITVRWAIARAHHGELTAASAGPGRGSRFEWHLPH